MLFRSPDDLRETIAAATELDVIQARARFSDLVDGIEPALSNDTSFELLAARHPLLMPQVLERLSPDATSEEREARRAKGGPVPVTVRLLPPSTVLLITGPNTGAGSPCTSLVICMASLWCILMHSFSAEPDARHRLQAGPQGREGGVHPIGFALDAQFDVGAALGVVHAGQAEDPDALEARLDPLHQRREIGRAHV